MLELEGFSSTVAIYAFAREQMRPVNGGVWPRGSHRPIFGTSWSQEMWRRNEKPLIFDGSNHQRHLLAASLSPPSPLSTGSLDGASIIFLGGSGP